MKGLVVFYTNCLLPKPLLQKTLQSAISAAESSGFTLVVSSHLPISPAAIRCPAGDFAGLANNNPDESLKSFLDRFDVTVDLPSSFLNVVTGVLNYSPDTILTQINHAIRMSRVDFDMPVVLWEHDVLYPDGYIDRVCEPIYRGVEYSLYRNHVFADFDGFYKPKMHFWHLSRYAAKISSLYDHFSIKINRGTVVVLEPVPAGFTNGEETVDDVVHNYEVVEGAPVLDIKHGANATGQMLIDGRSENDPAWGDFSGIRPLFLDDGYEDYLGKRPDVGYGLFTCKFTCEGW